MGSLIGKLFRQRAPENEDDVLGCDMVPSPSVLSTLYDQPKDDMPTLPASSASIGPFTTIAQAPIRDS